MVGATPALASSDPETMGGSLLVFLFLGFRALIVVLQLVPSVLLFGSMLKGLFGGAGNPNRCRNRAREFHRLLLVL